MFPFSQETVRHLGLFVKESPLENTPEVFVVLIDGGVTEIIPIYSIYDGDSHDGSVLIGNKKVLSPKMVILIPAFGEEFSSSNQPAAR